MAMSDTVWRSDAQSTVTDLLDRRLASDADGPYLDVMGSTFTAAEIERTGNAIANGLEPQEVAAQVFSAIREDRFYVLTHPEMTPLVEQRHEDIRRSRNPTTLGLT